MTVGFYNDCIFQGIPHRDTGYWIVVLFAGVERKHLARELPCSRVWVILVVDGGGRVPHLSEVGSTNQYKLPARPGKGSTHLRSYSWPGHLSNAVIESGLLES